MPVGAISNKAGMQDTERKKARAEEENKHGKVGGKVTVGRNIGVWKWREKKQGIVWEVHIPVPTMEGKWPLGGQRSCGPG